MISREQSHKNLSTNSNKLPQTTNKDSHFESTSTILKSNSENPYKSSIKIVNPYNPNTNTYKFNPYLSNTRSISPLPFKSAAHSILSSSILPPQSSLSVSKSYSFLPNLPVNPPPLSIDNLLISMRRLKSSSNTITSATIKYK